MVHRHRSITPLYTIPSVLKDIHGALYQALNEPSVSGLSASVEYEISIGWGCFGFPTTVSEGFPQRKGTRFHTLKLTQREPQVAKPEALSVS